MSELSRLTSRVRDQVDTRMHRILDERRGQWAAEGPAPTELLDAAEVLLQGGKRSRAVLAALGAGLDGGTPRGAPVPAEVVQRVGAALELYQASALVHDDVIDQARTRRGEPSSHVRLAGVHRDHRWYGQSEHFGASGAILLGDLLLCLAMEEMDGAAGHPGLAAERTGWARRSFNEMTTEVALGQYLDLRHEMLPLPGPDHDAGAAARTMHDHALAVVRRKSARYSVMHPLLLGAGLSGVRPGSGLMSALAVFGEETGIAFQLRDDVLGVFGDPAVTGKPAGDDLREGKRTVLLALAWERTDGAGRDLLRSVLAVPDIDEDRITAAAEVVRGCGAVKAHEEEIAAHRARALEALERETSLPPASRALLAEVCDHLTLRSA